MKTFDTKTQFLVTSSIGRLGQIDLKTVFFALSFLFYHLTKLLEFVKTISYEVKHIFWLPKTASHLLFCGEVSFETAQSL